MYRLFCDSNSELWYTKVQELGINVIRMPYVLDGEEHFYDMGEKHDFKAFFDRMRAGGYAENVGVERVCVYGVF